MKTIVALKLRTGEEVIGEVVTGNDIELKFRDCPAWREIAVPVVLRKPLVPGEVVNNGQRMMHLFKWPAMSKDEQFLFYPEDYLGEPYNVNKELEDGYLQITSGIALA